MQYSPPRLWCRSRKTSESAVALNSLAGQALGAVASQLVVATAKVQASDLLSQWEGFRTFCRDLLGVEPLTLTAAFGLERKDPAPEIRENHSDAAPHLQAVSGWAEPWTVNWNRRFVSR